MPNVKIYVEESLLDDRRAGLTAALLPIRDLLCDRLGVDVPACQLAVLPVIAMPDLPLVNAELFVLPRPDRTREALTAVAVELRGLLTGATGAHAAIRIHALDPETYVALK